MPQKFGDDHEIDKESPKIFIGGVASANEIEDFYKHMEEEDKKFDNYLVLYIDFLGTSEKIKDSVSSYESLQTLKFLFLNTIKTAQYIGEENDVGNYEVKIFSDNVVIAQKVNEKKLGDQIISLINLIGQLQFQALLQFDFLVRGGITIGELSIDSISVWGSSLIEAYNLEKDMAIYPRVILSENLIQAYEHCMEKKLNMYSMICKDFDGLWFVDFLIAAPNLKLIPTISNFLNDERTLYLDKDDKAKQKFNWLISYFNSYCHNFKSRGNYEDYILPLV